MVNALFQKGNFVPINESFMKESFIALKGLADIQKKYKKGDMDVLLNELHDSIVAKYLGFELINVDKHGFDCKLNYNADVFLESKVASYSSSTWSATFNDTTYEKANAFRSPNVWLALSIWTSVSDILCICYGQNINIGNILDAGVAKHMERQTVRSTQTISMRQLIFELDFKILSPVYPKEELLGFLNLHGLKKLSINHIVDYSNEFIPICQKTR